jgi:hypothetical protein
MLVDESHEVNGGGKVSRPSTHKQYVNFHAFAFDIHIISPVYLPGA